MALLSSSKYAAAALLSAAAVLMFAGILSRRAGAEHFEMRMDVVAGTSHGEAFADTTPPVGGVNPRPVVTAHSDESVRVTWRMKSNFPHGVMKNTTVHFYVVKEAQTAQKPVPDPSGPNGVVDNSFVMDFNPTSTAVGSLKFTIHDPGSYLIRVQSEDTHQEHDHEHFTAVDLEVR